MTQERRRNMYPFEILNHIEVVGSSSAEILHYRKTEIAKMNDSRRPADALNGLDVELRKRTAYPVF